MLATSRRAGTHYVAPAQLRTAKFEVSMRDSEQMLLFAQHSSPVNIRQKV